jgi:transposase-like protein
MRQTSKRIADSAEKTVRDIRRATRRHHSAEEKIRIVLEGLRGEDSIAELCRKEGINQNLSILSRELFRRSPSALDSRCIVCTTEYARRRYPCLRGLQVGGTRYGMWG